ncbi:PRC-barrel domain-containing protein [Streptomyces sp. HUAS TT20]|uniref:PRC-barrel domain-containing protein n=1 Tax=Streptomyces sp. HUAS TT20 TaxID=3447509 RepID=UPI0021D88B65|nr:PRC-barrel domain-containing protein [Streptomyces sp. HUAS 15-9]UXY32154.1 PRC-barrel domain-containing protein [Streptomyces sp. HUAS 15-9]
MNPCHRRSAAVGASDIREWRGHHVVDAKGNKIGTLESVYVDTTTDEPSFATVTVGLPTRRRLVFVPLNGREGRPGQPEGHPAEEDGQQAPSIDPDSVLPAEKEEAVFTHYGMHHDPGRRRYAATRPALTHASHREGR